MPTSDPGRDKHRREDRHEINFDAQLVIDKEVHAAAIDNLSIGGAKLKTKTRVAAAKDTACALRVENLGEFPGAIAWCGGGAVGIAFTNSDWRVSDAIMALAMYS